MSPIVDQTNIWYCLAETRKLNSPYIQSDLFRNAENTRSLTKSVSYTYLLYGLAQHKLHVF